MQSFDVVDPFELPEWLGTESVTWESVGGLTGGPHVRGRLLAGSAEHPLDLLAVDAAYPRTVCPNKQRHDAHQAWHFGEVLLLLIDQRVTAAVPATGFDPNRACDAIGRVARSIGVEASRFSVTLEL